MIVLTPYRSPDDFRLLIAPQEIVAVRRTLDPELTYPTNPDGNPNIYGGYNAAVTEITLKNGHSYLVTESIDDMASMLID
jgi:hypothetical protein